MTLIPVLREVLPAPRLGPRRGRPIMEFKELEPDWERYNAWRASLIESYAHWRRRQRQLGFGPETAPLSRTPAGGPSQDVA